VDRRGFFKRVGAGVGAVGVAAAGMDAVLVEPHTVEFTNHEVNERRPEHRSVLRFAQITDLHLRRLEPRHHAIATRVNSERPDFIAITGDSVDRKDALPKLERLLGLLDRATPKYAILGNWEHWSGVDLAELARVYARFNCELLINRTVLHPHDGGHVAITGVDDLVGRPDLRGALADVAPVRGRILLAHSPKFRDQLPAIARPVAVAGQTVAPALDSASYAFDVMLSGHTHGGQVTLFGWAPVLPPGSGRYAHGWFREGGPPLFVSRGIGTSVLPVRFMCKPEVSFFRMYV
jgi:predicted MPP superfamily phosphohydrolase